MYPPSDIVSGCAEIEDSELVTLHKEGYLGWWEVNCSFVTQVAVQA